MFLKILIFFSSNENSLRLRGENMLAIRADDNNSFSFQTILSVDLVKPSLNLLPYSLYL